MARLRHLALSDCPMPMTADPVNTLSQSLASARPWIQNVRCSWPAALVAGLALSAGLLAPAAALAGLLVATGLLTWQTHQLQRQRSELELIGQLLRCVNPTWVWSTAPGACCG